MLSAFLTGHAKLAHAGWDVRRIMPSGEIHDACGPVKGTVQTSYREEIRAIMHVFARFRGTFIIFCDCKSIVEQLQLYVCTRCRPEDGRASAWEIIYDLVDSHHEEVDIRWLPSHTADDLPPGAENEELVASHDKWVHWLKKHVYRAHDFHIQFQTEFGRIVGPPPFARSQTRNYFDKLYGGIFH